ncbi:MAG: hypothetical protein K2K81_06935, partial [Muribaculaceae bacterium]|nr:hypothetical protein [Muribaculaceae bacterium]
ISDLLLTYDPKEAQKYDITYYSVPFSKTIDDNTTSTEVDIYFLGQTKDRLSLIMETYHYLIKNGKKVNFILAEVPPEKQVELPGITYINGMSISYLDNLKNVLNSKCLLEIIQQNSSGDTIRIKEAIVYGKKILTNNIHIKERPFYNPENIAYFASPQDIDTTFLKSLSKELPIDYHYKEQLSPARLLEFIEKKLLSGQYNRE